MRNNANEIWSLIINFLDLHIYTVHILEATDFFVILFPRLVLFCNLALFFSFLLLPLITGCLFPFLSFPSVFF